MTTDNYKAAFEAATAEVEKLLKERSAIDSRLTSLKQAMDGLSSLMKDRPVDYDEELPVGELPGELFGETGITGAIRLILQRSKSPLAPVQIRTELMSHGFDLSDYANATAVIHNTLKRLISQREVTAVTDSSGKPIAYALRWVGPGSAERSGMRPDLPHQRLRKVLGDRGDKE